MRRRRQIGRHEVCAVKFKGPDGVLACDRAGQHAHGSRRHSATIDDRRTLEWVDGEIQIVTLLLTVKNLPGDKPWAWLGRVIGK